MQKLYINSCVESTVQVGLAVLDHNSQTELTDLSGTL